MKQDDSAPHPRRNSSDDERRARPRVPITVEVSLTSESHFYAGLTGDVSEGGVFVATWRGFSVGTRVEVALSLPDGPMTARGEVRWARRATEVLAPGVGVAFEPLGGTERTRIEAFCAARAPWYYELDG